jgi:aminoglycoside phosphotransferase (APT) family kinase protein
MKQENLQPKPNTIETVYRKFDLGIETAQIIFDKFNLGIVTKVKRFEQGMINDVFSINDTYVIKVNSAHPDIPKLQKEYSIYKVAALLGIPVPEVIACDESKEIIDYSYLVCKQLPGQSLEGLWKNIDAKKQDELLEHMGSLLGSIHSLTPTQLILPGQGEYPGLKEDITNRINVISNQLLGSKILTAEVVARIKNFYVNSPLFDVSINPSLLHGNYNLGNIIVNNNIEGIIDWEWASFGHSEEELAILLYRVYRTDHQKEKFKRGYLKTFTVSEDFDKRQLAYTLLYYLKVLPDAPKWTHAPQKQKEYFEETQSLIEKIGL